MDKQSIVAKAKEHIADGNTDQAIDLVEGFLANKPSYKLLHTESIHLSAAFNKTKQDVSNRTISYENAEISYGKVRQGLLELLDYVESDNFQPDKLSNTKPSWRQDIGANKWLLIVGVPLLLIAVAVLILVNKIGGETNTDCTVEFDGNSENRFLVLPFYNPDGSELKPEGLIVERLESFCASIESLRKSDFEICESYEPDLLLNFNDAAKKGEANKATIVIWGRAEKGGNTTVVKTRFKYLGGKDSDGKVPFTRLNQEGEQEVSTDKVLSSITSSGELTQDIETTLKLMVGMVANLEGNREGAIQAMHATEVTDSAANLLKYMILADNYIALNEPEKAKAALDTCLTMNNTYWLGRENRATLRMKDGDYQGAIEDLTVALDKKPDDTRLWIARGKAFKNSEQLYAAKQDFEKAIEMKPQAEPQIREALEDTKIEIKRLEKIVEPTKENMNSSKITKQQFLTAAAASNKLGDIATTKKLVSKGLEIDQNNVKLIAIQADNLLKERDTAKAKEVIKAAVKRNVRKEDIAKQNRNVAELIQEMSLKKEFEKE